MASNEMRWCGLLFTALDSDVIHFLGLRFPALLWAQLHCVPMSSVGVERFTTDPSLCCEAEPHGRPV
jgi:hypothetical protein